MGLCRWQIWLYIYLLSRGGNNAAKCIGTDTKIANTQSHHNSDVLPLTGQSLPNDFEYQLLELDVKVKHTDQYVTYKKNPRTEREKYTSKPGYLFCRIVKGDQLIAQVENERYFDRVILYKDQSGNRNMRCLFPGDTDNEDPDEPLPSIESDSSDNQMALVDISNQFSTDQVQYIYNHSNQSYTFTAKHGYVISRVTKGDRLLWDSRDYCNVCAISVYVGLNEAGEKVFRVYFPGQPPKFSPQVPDLKLKPNEIVLDVLEFLTRKFDPDKSPQRTKYNVRRLFNDLDYEIMPNIRCVRVTCGNLRVWDKGERGIIYPKSVTYTTDLNQVVVRNAKKGVIYQIIKGRMYYVSTSEYSDFDKPDRFADYYPYDETDQWHNYRLLDPEEKHITKEDQCPENVLNHSLTLCFPMLAFKLGAVMAPDSYP
ncbi:uncharacterized protein TOT_020000740 [Theileria orientalis strain Shintoku]|uniref:Uncharacterized protein n=1 Tax=Theileria orientalis strain Shintoku TaxID=869250 RepID=J4DPC9_THEOR|nr:uncharacterized protein TOT_020000740 [Theileria orientalis strain Shintoku]PVC51246.1 hypothetical protein MACL_00001683 [Theileria orientalis]BAM40484.1 uncharacterized protein TOT_020000740 [Theileria orientalis strain Shintoku]|eukprot:XP_009690785.1 uncharacterized protein TOT_020000740 [Theileria orientalis strain Shintoku]